MTTPIVAKKVGAGKFEHSQFNELDGAFLTNSFGNHFADLSVTEPTRGSLTDGGIF